MKPKSQNRLLIAALTFAGFTFAMPAALAASLYWDTDAATPGAGGATPSGTWSSSGITWSTDSTGAAAIAASTTLATDDLFFSAGTDATGAYTVTLSDTQNAKSLTFEDGSPTLSGTGGVVSLVGVGGNITVGSTLSATIGANTNTVIGGSVGLTKLGAGTLTLSSSAANPFTGGLNANGGTLVLDYNNLATPTDLVNNSNSLAIGGGGNLTITGKNVAAATTVQTFAGATLAGGVNTLTVAKGVDATSATLNLGALTINPGSATTILTGVSPATTSWATGVAPTADIINITSFNGNALPGSGKVNPSAGLFYRQSASAGTARWVSVDSAGLLQALPIGITPLLATTADPLLAHQVSTANVILTNTAASSYGLVLNASPASRTLTLAADGTYTINGILGVPAANGVTINPGTGTSGIVIGSERNLVINMDNGSGCTIAAPIADNGGGASSVTIASTIPSGTPGTVILSGANTYTGVTYVSRGFLTISNASALGTTAGNTVIDSGGQVFTSTASLSTAEAFDIAGGGLSSSGAIRIGGSATGVVFSGPITMSANAQIQADGNTGTTFSGGIDTNGNILSVGVGGGGTATVNTTGISGSGSVVKTSLTGNLNFNTANTYSGTTTINGGTLSLGNANALQNTSAIILGGATAATLATQTTDITLGAPITLANTGINSTISFGRNALSAGSLTLNGAIGGDGNLIFTTPNVSSGGNVQTINLGATGTWSGNTTMTTGNLNNATTIKNTSGAANVLPINTVLTMSGGSGSGSGRAVTFDLNGQNQELAGLQNTTAADRNQRVISSTAATLTINNSADYTFGLNTSGADPGSGQITGAVALTKKGAGTFTLASGIGQTFTGKTVVEAGILSLGHPTSLTNSPLDTDGSIAGDADNGLQTTVTTLTLGGLTGNKNLASLFETATGGYGSLTALTLNPGTGATRSYSADIGDGAGGMNLIKSGLGTQELTGTSTYTGTTSVNNGTLALGTSGSIATSASITIGANGTLDTTAKTTYTIPASQPLTFGINATGAGTSGKIVAADLNIATANVTYSITGTPDDPVYVLATYDNLDGIPTFASVDSPPTDYQLQYNYEGNKIALVKDAPLGYAAWQAANITAQTIDLDHDDDGVSNGVEFFLGGINDTTGFTTPLPGVTDTSGTLSVTWTKAASYPVSATYGTDFEVETSTTLTGVWTPVLEGVGADKVEITGNDVKYTFPAGTKNFARLKVTGP